MKVLQRRFENGTMAGSRRQETNIGVCFSGGFEMDSLYMVSHIIHPTKNSMTTLPVTINPRIMLGLMPSQIFLAREPAPRRLRAVEMPAEKRLGVSLVVFSEIAAAREDGFGGAAWVGAAPCSIGIWDANGMQVG